MGGDGCTRGTRRRKETVVQYLNDIDAHRINGEEGRRGARDRCSVNCQEREEQGQLYAGGGVYWGGEAEKKRNEAIYGRSRDKEGIGEGKENQGESPFFHPLLCSVGERSENAGPTEPKPKKLIIEVTALNCLQ